MTYFLSIFLFLSVFLEGTVTNLPLVVACLLCLTILQRDPLIFIYTFLAGIFLDAFALRALGMTSIYLLVVVFLIFLYQRKYEINTYPFVLIASFLGSLVYLVLFGYGNVFFEAVFSSIIALLVYTSLRLSKLKTQNY